MARRRSTCSTVVLDVERGHVPPLLPLVNGALAHVAGADDRHDLDQALA